VSTVVGRAFIGSVADEAELDGVHPSLDFRQGGQFYTPSRVVRLLVEMLAPYKGRVYDPCCGSGGMFVSLHAHA
jgi:hypothetical protein